MSTLFKEPFTKFIIWGIRKASTEEDVTEALTQLGYDNQSFIVHK